MLCTTMTYVRHFTFYIPAYVVMVYSFSHHRSSELYFKQMLWKLVRKHVKESYCFKFIVIHLSVSEVQTNKPWRWENLYLNPKAVARLTSIFKLKKQKKSAASSSLEKMETGSNLSSHFCGEEGKRENLAFTNLNLYII